MGIGGVAAGIFLLVRRKSLAKANEKSMVGRGKWTRFDYSEDYFRFLGTFGGIFFILAGALSLVSGFFRESNPVGVGYILYGIVAIIFLAFLISIPYVYLKFGNKKW
jgi:intracellular septation protein A